MKVHWCFQHSCRIVQLYNEIFLVVNQSLVVGEWASDSSHCTIWKLFTYIGKVIMTFRLHAMYGRSCRIFIVIFLFWIAGVGTSGVSTLDPIPSYPFTLTDIIAVGIDWPNFSTRRSFWWITGRELPNSCYQTCVCCCCLSFKQLVRCSRRDASFESAIRKWFLNMHSFLVLIQCSKNVSPCNSVGGLALLRHHSIRPYTL